MPVRSLWGNAIARPTSLRSPGFGNGHTICSFCSIANAKQPASKRRPKRVASTAQRQNSTASLPATNPKHVARKELERALTALQQHASNFVNLSRVQLAINGLRQQPGNESIRVAVLGLTNGAESGNAAKTVLKLLLADPLKDEEGWEREVDKHDIAQPMIIRIGSEPQQESGAISMAKRNPLHEVNVSSATLNGHSLELLLMESTPYVPPPEGRLEGFEDSILVPAVEIPISNTGRYTPVTTPVHKTLLITDGLVGAASIASLPIQEGKDIVMAAVNIPGYVPVESSLPFATIDIDAATRGLGLVRKSLNEAMEYEHLWFQSNLPKLVEWLKADVMSNSEGKTKAPLQRLIASILHNVSTSIQHEESRQLSDSLSRTTSTSVVHLKSDLAGWAEIAHTELQEQLDVAFSSRRWRKLGWWKLFWRVDDVHMLTTDILNQRFLPSAEKNAIYLAGQIREVVRDSSTPLKYGTPNDEAFTQPQIEHGLWPASIPAARGYLQNETVPALQALAQKLVLQTLSTSALTTSLGALVYFGTLTTGIYEAGAVAALGIVWSMRRMQKRWETARTFWEGEVREEGRKAVSGVEIAIAEVLNQEENSGAEVDAAKIAEVNVAKELLAKASEALERLE